MKIQAVKLCRTSLPAQKKLYRRVEDAARATLDAMAAKRLGYHFLNRRDFFNVLLVRILILLLRKCTPSRIGTVTVNPQTKKNSQLRPFRQAKTVFFSIKCSAFGTRAPCFVMNDLKKADTASLSKSVLSVSACTVLTLIQNCSSYVPEYGESSALRIN